MVYARTEIADLFSIRAIESVWNIDLANVIGGSEEHDFPELFYVKKGKHTTCLDDVPYELSEGQFIIYAPHAFHTGIPGVQGTAIVGIIGFEVSCSDLMSMCNRVITLSPENAARLEAIIDDGAALFEKLPPDSPIKGISLKPEATLSALHRFKHALELFLVDVFGINEPSAGNKANYRREQFDRAVEYMKSNLSATLTLEDIAAETSMSLSKLSGLFKEQCGIGPIAYFNKLKISEAQRLIRDTAMNFTEISEEVGIHSVHYFSKIFKKHTSMTPSEYAKNLDL